MKRSIYTRTKNKKNHLGKPRKTRAKQKQKQKEKKKSRRKRTSHVNPPFTLPPIRPQNAHWPNHVSIHSFPTAPRRLMLSLAALVCSVSNITSSSAPS